jgi:hypothetical protein
VGLGAAVALAAVVSAAVPAGAATSAEQHGAGPTATTAVNRGVPTVIDPEGDLGRKPVAGSIDSIYVAGRVSGGGHKFGFLVQSLVIGGVPGGQQTVTITDETTGWFKAYEVAVPADKFRWDTGATLNIHTPELTWTGNADQQKITASTPWGALDLDLDAQGPVMSYAGTGTFTLMGTQQTEYALPQMRTTGTLTAEGRIWNVAGDTWFDRQWGPLPQLGTFKWSWMNLNLPGGDKIAVWDALSASGTQETWATVLHPDGTHELVPVTPFAQDAGAFWTSPQTGRVYPTRWKITIPTRNTSLTVVASPQQQEIAGPTSARLEATATFTGKYQGRHVTGKTFVELVGNWTD